MRQGCQDPWSLWQSSPEDQSNRLNRALPLAALILKELEWDWVLQDAGVTSREEQGAEHPGRDPLL